MKKMTSVRKSTGVLSPGLCALAALASFAVAPARVTAQEPVSRTETSARPQESMQPGDYRLTAVPKPRKAIADMEKRGWNLTFEDEFSGTKLDTSRWIDSYPDNVRTHSNNEQQYYAPDGYKVAGGRLSLIAQRRAMGEMPYTSGIVTTYGKFSQAYGWFEIRAKFPAGKGLWPAFWLLPADKSWPPEVDILEVLGHEPNVVYLTNHAGNAEHKLLSKGSSFKGPDFSAGFHTFAVDWSPAAIIWYVDGTERFRVTENIPSVPMYVLTNLAVGGSWPGNPDVNTPFPSAMEVDYVRVYKRSDTQTTHL